MHYLTLTRWRTECIFALELWPLEESVQGAKILPNFQKFPGEQIVEWKKCCKVHICDMNGNELEYEDLKKMVSGKFNRFDLSHLTQEFLVKIDK